MCGRRGARHAILRIVSRYLAYREPYACQAHEARGQRLSCMLSGGGGGYLVWCMLRIVYLTCEAIVYLTCAAILQRLSACCFYMRIVM